MGDKGDSRDWERVRRSSTDAFRAIFDKHYVPVYRYARHLVSDGPLAEDITQIVFMKAWDKRRKIDLVQYSVLPWLLATARFEVYNARRRRQSAETKEKPLEILSERTAPSIEDIADRVELQTVLSDALDTLSEEDKAVVALCLIDGFTYESAAAAFATTPSTIRNRLHRARKHLRDQISREVPNGQ